MTFAMVLDLVVVLLLIPTIVFAVILNNRLSVLRKNREELARMITAFNEATVRAEGGIPRLRKTSEEASKALQEKAERAQLLRDDLAFMIERAENQVSRLESSVQNSLRVATPRAEARPAASRVGPPPLVNGLDIESAAAAAAGEEYYAPEPAPVPPPAAPAPPRRPAAVSLAAGLSGGLPAAGSSSSLAGGLAGSLAEDGYGPGGEMSGSSLADESIAERIDMLKDFADRVSGDRGAGERASASRGIAGGIVGGMPAEYAPAVPQERLPAAPARPVAPSAADTVAPRPAAASRPARAPGASLAGTGRAPLGAALTVTPPPVAGGVDDDDRSEAERELLRALRSVR